MEKICSQSTSPGFSWEIAVWPRSEQPSGRTDTETPFGEIQSIAHGSADSIVSHPSQDLLAHTSLQHEVFDEATNRIVSDAVTICSVHAKATSESAGNVVFAPPPSHARN